PPPAPHFYDFDDPTQPTSGALTVLNGYPSRLGPTRHLTVGSTWSCVGLGGRADMSGGRRLRQFVLKPTVFCYHRCPYCDLRQDYYRDMVASRKKELRVRAVNGSRLPNPGHMPRELALRLVDEAAALGMEELQLSGGDPLLYPHLVDVIRAGKRHPGVFVL